MSASTATIVAALITAFAALLVWYLTAHSGGGGGNGGDGGDDDAGTTGTGVVDVNPTTGHPLSFFTVSGQGFTQDQRVEVTFGEQAGSIVQVTGGKFTTLKLVPSVTPGTYNVYAIGMQSGYRTKATFYVSSP